MLIKLLKKYETEGLETEGLLLLFSGLLKKKPAMSNYYREVCRRLVICEYLKDNGSITNKGKKLIAYNKTNKKAKQFSVLCNEMYNILSEPV